MIVFVLGPATAAAQEARVEIGFLTCSVAESGEARGAGEIAPLRQTQEMLCAFRPTENGAEETYIGTFQSIGQDQGRSAGGVMIWIVKAVSSVDRSAGLLQQTYAADPAAVAGHAPPLIGEANSSVLLQAMADPQGQAAADKQQLANSAVIVVVALTLRSASA